MKINWLILACAIWFDIEQAHIYGWHFWPKSEMELLSDGISLILLALAVNKGVWEKKTNVC